MTALELWALLKRCWWAPVIIALTFALLATRATLADCRAERVVAETNLKTSNASIGRLEAEIARITAEQRQLATSDAARVEASKQSLALAEAAGKVRQAAIDRLEASAEAAKAKPASAIPDQSDCEFSAAVLENWQ